MHSHNRLYKEGDLDPLKRLMAELGYKVEIAELRKNVREIQESGGEIFVHELNGNVVGCVCVLIDVRLAEGIFAEIVSLIVSEKERGKGIGAGLVRVAEEWARQRVGKIRVRANVVREAAYSFYKSQGYRYTKSQNVFIKSV
jgi:GNAT superfamily N-acetyltransferase